MLSLSTRGASLVLLVVVALASLMIRPSRTSADALAPSASPAATWTEYTPQRALVPTETCSDTWQTISSKSVNSDHIFLRGVAALSATSAWAVGWYYSYDFNAEQPLIQHWDGVRWLEVPTPNFGPLGGELQGVTALSATNAWAVGYVNTSPDGSPQLLVLHWDGTHWSRVSSPSLGMLGRLYAVDALSANEIWAVGESYGPLVIHWNGVAWQKVTVPKVEVFNWLNGVVALASNAVWAVGGASPDGGLVRPYILRWNGSVWSAVNPASISGYGELFGVAGISAQDVWAVGNDNVDALTMHWNGTAWSRVSSPNTVNGNNYLYGVAALAANDVWAVGYDSFNTISLHWDGSVWRSIPAAGNHLLAVTALPAGGILAVGYNGYQSTRTLVQRHATTISFSSAAFSGSPAAGSIPVTVALRNTTPQTVTVDYVVSAGTAIPGTDFTLAQGTLVVPPCTQTATIQVAVKSDADWSRPKTIKLSLKNPRTASLGTTATAVLAVVDPQQIAPGLQVYLPLIERSAPAEGRIAFVSQRDGNDEIYVMNADGSGERRLTNQPTHDLSPAWSPDGQRIAFVSYRDGNAEIYVMNADGSGLTRLTYNSFEDYQPAWSHDGQRIAFVSNREQRNGVFYSLIYVMNADGSQQTRLTSPRTVGVNPLDNNPSWSLDGQRIAFDSLRETPRSQIYIVNADGSQLSRLVTTAVECQAPSWSPDGQRILFGCGSIPFSNLYTSSTDGQTLARVNDNFDTGSDSAWSPDGRRVVYSDNQNIYITQFDHSQPVQLTSAAGPNFLPVWSAP